LDRLIRKLNKTKNISKNVKNYLFVCWGEGERERGREGERERGREGERERGRERGRETGRERERERGCHKTQHNNTLNNDTQHNGIRY
jgi:hypothetical protein